MSPQPASARGWECAARGIPRCAGVITRGQLCRQAHVQNDERVPSPHEVSLTVHDVMRPQGGGVAALPKNSGGVADPPLESAHHHVLPLHEDIGWTAEELQKLQVDDCDINPVVQWMKQNQRPPSKP